MTPEERQLVDELFDRLAALEHAPRDPDAERAIRDGLAAGAERALSLVQTALVQDEALKRAKPASRSWKRRSASATAAAKGGFLDNMRDAIFGGGEKPRGSVPNGVRRRAGTGRWARRRLTHRQGSPWGGGGQGGSAWCGGQPPG